MAVIESFRMTRYDQVRYWLELEDTIRDGMGRSTGIAAESDPARSPDINFR